MAFPFCFYGLTYNNMIAGSNGLITFEALCAHANNAYTLTVAGSPQPGTPPGTLSGAVAGRLVCLEKGGDEPISPSLEDVFIALMVDAKDNFAHAEMGTKP